MSWATGFCCICEKYNDYKYSWGYSKPDGLLFIGMDAICTHCLRDYKAKLQNEKKIDVVRDLEIYGLIANSIRERNVNEKKMVHNAQCNCEDMLPYDNTKLMDLIDEIDRLLKS
jgi:hypothetical protein